MAVFCEICNKSLNNNYTLKRHLHLMHGQMSVGGDMEESESDNSQQSSGEEDGSDKISTDSSESEEQVESGWNNQFWRNLIKSILSTMEIIPSTIEELKTDQYFTKFLEQLRTHYKAHEFMQDALYDSDLNNRLQKTTRYYMDKLKFNRKEAEDMSWFSRKYLFKKLLERNADTLEQEWLKRQDTEIDDSSSEHEQLSALQAYNRIRM